MAFASPGNNRSNSRRQQQQELLRPEKGTWGLGRIAARDVSCSTNEGLSAPENVSVFEAYRLHSTSATNEHNSVITVRPSAHGAVAPVVALAAVAAAKMPALRFCCSGCCCICEALASVVAWLLLLLLLLLLLEVVVRPLWLLLLQLCHNSCKLVTG